MTGEVVNLRRARKARARQDAEAKAAAPAAERTPAQRAATVAMLTRALATAKASGDATRIAKAEKALATAKANLVTPPKAAKAAGVQVISMYLSYDASKDVTAAKVRASARCRTR